MCLPFAKTHMELNQLTPEPWQLESTFPLQPGDSKPWNIKSPISRFRFYMPQYIIRLQVWTNKPVFETAQNVKSQKKGMLSDQFGPFTFVTNYEQKLHWHGIIPSWYFFLATLLHSHPFFIHRTDSQRYSSLAMEPRLSSEFVSNIWRDATELLLKQGIRKLVLHLRVRKVNLKQFGFKFGMISDTTDHQELVWGSYKTQTPTKQVNSHHGIAQWRNNSHCLIVPPGSHTQDY